MKRYPHIIAFISILLFSITAKAQSNEYITHTVTRGQTLFSISKMYGTTVDAIKKNNMIEGNSLSIGQVLSIPQNNRSNTVGDNNALERDGKRYHTIRSKETLFSLSKKYGVTIDDICLANPGISIKNFPVGKEIVIPHKDNDQVSVKPENKKDKEPAFKFEIKKEEKLEIQKTHKVKRRETIKKICKKYGITEEDFLKANPQLEGREVKRKMIVNIPKKREIPVDKDNKPTVAEDKTTDVDNHLSQEDGVTRVAVILPYLLDRYAPDEQKLMIEFYQGFLMSMRKLKLDIAKDRTKKKKYAFEISTFDSGFKDNDLDSLLTSGALDNMDLIIGAYYPNHNKQLAGFALKKGIPLVMPFSNKQEELYDNPMVFFVNTLQSSIQPDVAKNFVTTFPDANVIFVEDTVKSNKKSFVNELIEELTANNIPYTTVQMEQIVLEKESTIKNETGESDEDIFINTFRTLAIDSLRRNVIIPMSSSKETLNRILPSLVMAKAIAPDVMQSYMLFGYPEWQVYAQQTREQIYEVDTYFYATFFTHFSLPEASRFHDDFKRWYNCDPQKIYPCYSMLGYDIGYHFVLAASMYGKEFPEKINEIEGRTQPIQTGFKFERMKENGAMMNKKLYFIHYSRDYNIEKINL